MHNFAKNIKTFLVAGLLLILIWSILIILIKPAIYILPPPWIIAKEIFTRFNFYMYHTFNTIFTATTGLMVGVILGVILAITSIVRQRSRSLIEAFGVVLRTLPIVAIAPIIILWFGTERISQIVIVTIICFFPIFSGLLRGMERADPAAIKLMKLYESTRFQMFYHLQVPSAIPTFIQSFPLAVTLAVLGALVAEFTGYDRGLGSLVLRGLFRLDSKMLFSSNVLAALIGITFYVFSFMIEFPFQRFITTRKIEEKKQKY